MREGHVDLKIMEKNAFNHYILITLSYIFHYITLFFYLSLDLNKELSSFGLKSPAKIMVFGKKPDEEDENFKLMKKWESACDSSAQKLSALQHEIEDIEKV